MGFYAVPFIKANDAIVFLNKNKTDDYEDETWLDSKLQSLQIVDEEYLEQAYYKQIKSERKISLSSWNQMTIDCTIHVEVKDFETWDFIREYEEVRSIQFAFKDGKWKVQSVK